MPDRPQSIRPLPARPGARRAPAHSQAHSPAHSLALALALVLLPALPAPAQSPPSMAPTADCVAAAPTEAGRLACIGRSAEACRLAAGGDDPVDGAICLNAETGWWRKRLSAALLAMQTRAEALDAQQAAAIARGEPRLTDDLQAYQQAWKGFAEQRCAFEAMLLRGSPKRMLAAATCLLRTTAEQALFLETSARH